MDIEDREQRRRRRSNRATLIGFGTIAAGYVAWIVTVLVR